MEHQVVSRIARATAAFADIHTTTATAPTAAAAANAGHAGARSGHAVPAASPRFDIYGSIHKGIRAFINSTLLKAGSMDVNDEPEMRETLAQVRELLAFLHGHLEHENAFIHTAMQAVRPNSSIGTADDHVEHEQAIAELSTLAAEIEAAPAASRFALAQRLYRRLALFAAENFEHMDIEETENNAVLWASYTDPEIIAIHQRILDHVPPEQMGVALKWMMRAVSHAERVGMLNDMRMSAPAPVFDHVVASIQPELSEKDWGKLAKALSL